MIDVVQSSEASYIIKKVMDNLKKRYVEEDENLVKVDKLFLVSSIVHDVIEKKLAGELSDEQCKHYFIYIEKYLNGDIDMFWEEGVVKVKRRTNYDEERRKALESLQAAYKKMLGGLEPSENKPEE